MTIEMSKNKFADSIGQSNDNTRIMMTLLRKNEDEEIDRIRPNMDFCISNLFDQQFILNVMQ